MDFNRLCNYSHPTAYNRYQTSSIKGRITSLVLRLPEGTQTLFLGQYQYCYTKVRLILLLILVLVVPGTRYHTRYW
jgi:hypothetical protein